MGEKAILWFTKDLRVQDNECLSWLCKNEAPFVGLIFKPEGQSEFQKEFFRASAESLQKNLEKFNIKLFCVEGRPETELIKWVKINEINYVLTTSAYNSRDRETINKVDTELRTKSEARLKIFDQSTLLHLEDLPFTLVQLPTTFTPFRKLLEESWRVRDVVEQEYKNLQRLEALVPTETRLLDVDKQSTTLPMPYGIQGGEAAAWDRLKEFLWNTKSIDLYKEKRNGMLEKKDSSKFSPWLANGCISARSIYHEIKKYEQQYGANDSTYWLIFELLWRDYFKFHSLKISEQLFNQEGALKKEKPIQENEELYLAWCQGETGLDFIDANMKELVQTGWMSNRGRQNVASYFSKQRKQNWVRGAEFFAKHLVDYDVESNWGNWQYLAGVGADPRDRDFNIQRQAEHYDPDFKYRNKWLKKMAVNK